MERRVSGQEGDGVCGGRVAGRVGAATLHRIIYPEKWPLVLPGFLFFGGMLMPRPCPRPAKSESGTRAWEGGAASPADPDRASRLEGGLGPDCCRSIQTLHKDFQPFCPCRGPEFCFPPAPGAVSGTTSAFPDYADLVWVGIRQTEARQGEGMSHNGKPFASPDCGGNSHLDLTVVSVISIHHI